KTKSESVTVSGDSNTYAHSAVYNMSTGFMTSQTAYGITTTYEPDADGNVHKRRDARGNTTTLGWSWGVPSSIQTPEYSVSRVVGSDSTIASESRRGFTTTYSYDGLFRPTAVYPPVGNAVTTSYGSATSVLSGV